MFRNLQQSIISKTYEDHNYNIFFKSKSINIVKGLNEGVSSSIYPTEVFRWG